MTNAPPVPWWSLQKAIRQARLTQVKLAERSGLSKTYIGYLASGERRPNADLIALLAGALDVTVEELSEGVCLTTSPAEMLNEIDDLVEVLDSRIKKANVELSKIKAQREELEQLQVSA